MNATRIALVMIVIMPLLSACAARPNISVERAAWSERADDASVMHIDVEVSNPSNTPLELREMRYRVLLDGQRVYHGRRSTSQTIAPGGSVFLTVPVVVQRADAVPTGNVSMIGSVGFITPGRMALVMRDLGLPPLRRDFTGEARLAPGQ